MYRIIGAATGWGAQLHSCEKGPDALYQWGLLDVLKQKHIPISEWKTIYPKKSAPAEISEKERLQIITAFNIALAKEVEKTLDCKQFPVVIGGDHSIAVGMWNGFYSYLRKKNTLPFGLIWIDAHMDAHTHETTPSGAYHGMPLAALLGIGDPTFVKLYHHGHPLSPENICLIGVRSFEEEEAKLLKDLNVRIFFIEEVIRKGFAVVLKEAINHISQNVAAFGVSVDLDVIDPTEAPGVGSPAANGIGKKDLLDGLSLLQKEEKFQAFELVEYNPEKDSHNKTAELSCEILLKVLG